MQFSAIHSSFKSILNLVLWKITDYLIKVISNDVLKDRKEKLSELHGLKLFNYLFEAGSL